MSKEPLFSVDNGSFTSSIKSLVRKWLRIHLSTFVLLNVVGAVLIGFNFVPSMVKLGTTPELTSQDRAKLVDKGIYRIQEFRQDYGWPFTVCNSYSLMDGDSKWYSYNRILKLPIAFNILFILIILLIVGRVIELLIDRKNPTITRKSI